MTALKTIATGAVAALALAGSLLASAGEAQARSYRGGAIAAGIVGGVALGVMAAEASRPRVVRVVRVKKVRHHHGCGCHHHRRHHHVRLVF